MIVITIKCYLVTNIRISHKPAPNKIVRSYPQTDGSSYNYNCSNYSTN